LIRRDNPLRDRTLPPAEDSCRIGRLSLSETVAMDPIRIGLAGFGRIGRSLLRIVYRRQDVELVAITDIADHRGLEYLLRFDTILGRFPDPVSIKDGWLYAAGRRIRMLSGEKPGDVPWGELGVDVVVEATARFRSRAELEGHLAAGAKRVILCAPPTDPPDLTLVPGVSDQLLRPGHRIVSNASCTAHAAAPVARILADAFGIERAFLTVVHAFTNQQRLADVPDADKRRGRAAAENIIPQETNAGEVIVELIPELAGRLTAAAMNVPVANGSVVDLVAWHREEVSVEAINEVMRTAAGAERWRATVHYEGDPIVSSDVAKSPFSAVFDSQATMVLGQRVSKTLTWFDNAWGYAHRVVELIERLGELDREAA
jgi:glyceraldehyde 3-phosphate dehydrogenase